MLTKITQKTIETTKKHATETGKGIFLWDTELSGFGVYVSPKGAVSFNVQKWAGGRGGKAVRFVVGRAREGMTLPEAQTLARGHIGDISRGSNPVKVRREKRAVVKQELHSLSVSDALDMYLPKGKLDTRHKEATRRDLLREFTSHGLLKKKVSDVSRGDVRKMIREKELEGKKAAARNLLAALRPFFSYCRQEEFISVSPALSVSSPPPVTSRDRLLSSSEVRAVWLASNSLSPVWRDFYRLTLITGQRRDEVSGMSWDEIDLDGGLWTLPKERSKNGRAHLVHLSPLAVSILKEGTPEDRRKGLVFTTTGETSISGFSKAKRQLDEAMKLELSKEDKQFVPFRVHDFRRTLASHLAELGVSTDVADRILNYVSGSMSGVKGVYQRYEFIAERKEALLTWSEKINSLTDNGLQKAA